MSALFTIDGNLTYEITRKIADGRIGVVFEANQLGAEGFVKQVAIKVLHERLAVQRQFIENFIGEAKLVADLIHTNIVQIYHFGEESRTLYRRMGVQTSKGPGVALHQGQSAYYMVFEMVKGLSLHEFIHQLHANSVPLPGELAVFIASRIARGLAYAHAKKDIDGKTLGIVHRDVSPKSIMMSYDGDVKLTDFGIAKAAGLIEQHEGEQLAGTPEYMSPEQANFEVTDHRSDVFSTGVLLSELLLGKNIFLGRDAAESREKIQNTEIPNFREASDQIDLRLDAIMQRCLSRDLDTRYPDADLLMKDLEYQIYHKGYGPTNETLGKFIRKFVVEIAD